MNGSVVSRRGKSLRAAERNLHHPVGSRLKHQWFGIRKAAAQKRQANTIRRASCHIPQQRQCPGKGRARCHRVGIRPDRGTRRGGHRDVGYQPRHQLAGTFTTIVAALHDRPRGLATRRDNLASPEGPADLPGYVSRGRPAESLSIPARIARRIHQDAARNKTRIRLCSRSSATSAP